MSASALAHTHRSIDKLLELREDLEGRLRDSVTRAEALTGELAASESRLAGLERDFQELGQYVGDNKYLKCN